MRRLIVLVLCTSAVLTAAASAGAPEPAARVAAGAGAVLSFEPSKVRLDLKDTKVLAVLKAIERQTGNRIAVSGKVNNIDLPAFKAEGEPFWTVLDRLCKVSGNIYLWEAKSG